MKVLGIESSGDTGGVAIAETGHLLGEMCLDLAGAHTQRLAPATAQLLREIGAEVSGLGGVAVSLGPGSFTGLRAGLGLAKGLAYSRGLKLVGVPTLEVLAAGAEGGEWVLALADARRGEVFFALYRRSRGRLRECWPVRLGTVEGLARAVQETVSGGGEGLRIVADGTSPLEEVRDALSGTLGAELTAGRSTARPGWVALLGAERLEGGVNHDPMTLEPLYVRPSDAETKGRR